jgi:hypothetical protein
MSEVCCELGFVAPPLAACEGALDGCPDSCRRAARAAANGGCSTGTVAPGAGTREACGVEDATPSVISTSSTRTMGTKKMMKCDQLAPLPGAPNVVVLQTTAGWRKAPALAQRVCTRGLASLRSIFLKNTMNTAGFRVVRAAGA